MVFPAESEARGLRVLGRVRLSRFTLESTSVERQKEIVTEWAKQHDHTIVGWAIDTDFSRSIDPFSSPEFGPWLKDPEKIDLFDIVACWKLDRIGAGSVYLNKVIGFCGEHGKSLVSVTENFDLNHWVGRLIANVIAGVAEGELEAIKERTQGSQNKLRAVGRWHGGVEHYGYIATKTAEGWKLVLDPYSSGIMRECFDWLVEEGLSVEAICERLNARGVLTPRDYYRQYKKDRAEQRGELYTGKDPEWKNWNSQTMFKLLESRTFLGFVTHEGEVVIDDEGVEVCKAEALLTPDEYNRIQGVLKSRRFTKRNNRTSDASPLLGVILCLECDSNMHHRANTVKGKQYRYYYCPNKHGQSVRAGEFEDLFHLTFLRQLGQKQVEKKVYIPAVDHSAELALKVQTVEDLTSQLSNAKSNMVRDSLTAKLAALDARIAVLEELPSMPARTELVPTGKTYEETWMTSDQEARRQLLINSGIRVKTIVTNRGRSPEERGESPIEVWIPADISQRMDRQATKDFRDYQAEPHDITAEELLTWVEENEGKNK